MIQFALIGFFLITLISLVLRKQTATFFLGASLTLALSAIVFSPVIFYDISITVILCYFVTLLTFFVVESIFGRKVSLPHFNVSMIDLYFKISIGLGLFGFLLKVHINSVEYGLNYFSFLQYLISRPFEASIIMASPFSTLHLAGLIGVIYFPLTSKEKRYFGLIKPIFLILYMISLALLFKKVFLTYGLFSLVIAYLVRERFQLRLSYILPMILVGTAGGAYTVYDNYQYSNEISIGFEFLSRYLSGSLVAFSAFLDGFRPSGNSPDIPVFFSRLNPILEIFFPYIDLNYEKIFYVVNKFGGTTNTLSLLGSLYVGFGFFGSFFFLLVALYCHICLTYLMAKSNIGFLFLPFFVYSSLCWILSFIGNAFFRLDMFLVCLTPFLIALAQKIMRQKF